MLPLTVGPPEERRMCGNTYPYHKLAGEPCHLETWTQGSEEGSWKSAARELAGCLSHCPRAAVLSIFPSPKGLVVSHASVPVVRGADMACDVRR